MAAHDDPDPDSASGAGRAVPVVTRDGTARLAVPATATDAEAGALAAAIAAHLAHERAGGEEESPPEEVDPWTLAGRLRARTRTELPRSCRPGEAWKLAARRY